MSKMTDKAALKLKALSLLLDLLERMKVLRTGTWYSAHGMKWTLLGKPEWAKRKGLPK